MFALTAPPQPEWLTLVDAEDDTPAVRVLFAPIGAYARDAAKTAVAQLYATADDALREELAGAYEDGKLVRPLSPAGNSMLRAIGHVSSMAMIREGIRDWEGIGDENGGPLPVTPRAIDWFLGHDLLFTRADLLYVMPIALRDAEKNGSAGSPDGIGAEATPAPDTASSCAKPSGTDAAGIRTPKRRSAPISSKSRKPKAG